MKKSIITLAVILFFYAGIMAQIHLPSLNNRAAGLEMVKPPMLKHELKRPSLPVDYQWYAFPSLTQDVVSQASVASDGSALVIFYRKPLPSLNIDEGIVEKWTGSHWAVQTNLTNQCHEPDIDIDDSVIVATWYDDGYDYGYGTNINGPWVSLTGNYLYKQWFPRAAMAMGLPYMSFTCKYSDGQPASYDMLHIISILGVGQEVELNGGWRVIYTSVGQRTDITGDENAWYCIYHQQEYLYVMKGAVVNSQKEYTDLGDGFRMHNPVSHPEIILYKGNPVVGWFENANMEIYIAQWNGSDWMVLGAGSIPTGSLYSLRMASSADYLYVSYASTDADTAISVNLWDGEKWYEMPPVQHYFNSDIGTVDIAVHNDEPVVAFTENNLLTVKKFTHHPVTHTDPLSADSGLFTCFPNPTHDVITLQANVSGFYSVKISSLTGQVIHHQEFTGLSLPIDLSRFSTGIYFLTLQNKEHRVTQRIVRF